MDQERSRIDQASRTAEEFTRNYYDVRDRRRHMISRLYLDTGTLVWNGTPVCGKEFIQKFFESLPSTDHVVASIDAQPFFVPSLACPTSSIINVAGYVTFADEPPVPFQQHLLLTAEGDKWKIVTETYRLQEPYS